MNNTNTMKDKKIHTSDAIIQINNYNDRKGVHSENIEKYRAMSESLEETRTLLRKLIKNEKAGIRQANDMIELLNQY